MQPAQHSSLAVSLIQFQMDYTVTCSVSKTDVVTGSWQMLRKEELHTLHSSKNIRITKLKKGWAGHVARMKIWEINTKFQLKSLKGRDHSEDVIIDGRICLREIRFGGVDWFDLTSDRNRWRAVANWVTIWATVSFSTRTVLHTVV
jgi:hypothetical protein